MNVSFSLHNQNNWLVNLLLQQMLLGVKCNGKPHFLAIAA